MNFAFNDEQQEIRAAAQRMMEETSKPERVRELSETETGWAQDDWNKIAELGWTGMHIPEQYGGVGLTYVELIVLLEQMGGALYSSPFFATVCMAANALLAAESGDKRDALLAAIAAGELTATVAQTEPGGGWDFESIAMTAKRDGDEFVLSGTKSPVIDGHSAGVILVAARTGDGDDGITVFAVDGDAASLTRTQLEAFDLTRKQAQLEFSDVRVPAAAAIGREGDGQLILTKMTEFANVALAAEMLGASQRCFNQALEYAGDRYQFGRPISSFQAIKHRFADLLQAVEQSRSAAYYAGWVAANSPDELPVVASLVKAFVADSAWFVARENIQIHGGIGFTWEHDAHFFYRRARSSQSLFGDSDAHRELMLQQLGV